MLVLGFVALLATLAAAADPECRMKSKRVVPTETALLCLQAPKLDQEVFRHTQETVELAMQMNVFHDISKKPSAPYQYLATDVEKQVALLRERYENNASATAWDYMGELANAFTQLKDAHTLFVRPSFFSRFRIGFPLAITVDENKKTHFAALPESLQFITSTYSDVYEIDPAEYIGREIITIDGMDPMLWLAQWADKHVYATKSAHGRLNSALNGDLNHRGLNVFALPEGNDKIVSFELKDGSFVLLEFVVYSTLTMNNNAEAIALYEASIVDMKLANAEPATIEPPKRSGPLHRFMEERAQTRARRTAAAKSLKTASEEFQHVLGDDVFDLYQYKSSDVTRNGDVVFVLCIYSFSPEDINENAINFVKALEHVKEHNLTQLIVSVVANGGGWVSLGHLLGRALVPSAYPIYGSYNIRVNEVTDALAQLNSLFLRMRRTDPYTGDVITNNADTDNNDWYLQKRESYTEIDRDIYNNTKSVLFSSRFAFDDDSEDSISEGLTALYNFAGLDLSPDRIAIVTDGQCGSTCACFAKHLGEDKRVSMIGLGGVGGIDGYEHAEEPYDVAAFAGGTVDDTRNLEDHIEYMESLGTDLPDVLKKVKMPTDGYMRFAFHQIFSWDVEAHKTTSYAPLEYLPVPVHTTLPVYPTNEDWQGLAGLPRYTSKVYSLLKTRESSQGTCTDPIADALHMNRPTGYEEGATCEIEGDSHARGAYDCSGKCVRYDCEKAYGRSPYALDKIIAEGGSSKDWKCELRSDEHAFDNLPDIPEDHSIHGGHIALLIVTLIVVVALLYILAVWAKAKCAVRREKLAKAKPEDEDSAPLLKTESD